MNQNSLIPIQLVVRHNGKRIRKNTAHSVLEQDWSGHRVKPNLKKEKENNYQLINQDLQEIEEKVSKLFFISKPMVFCFLLKNLMSCLKIKKNYQRILLIFSNVLILISKKGN